MENYDLFVTWYILTLVVGQKLPTRDGSASDYFPDFGKISAEKADRPQLLEWFCQSNSEKHHKFLYHFRAERVSIYFCVFEAIQISTDLVSII